MAVWRCPFCGEKLYDKPGSHCEKCGAKFTENNRPIIDQVASDNADTGIICFKLFFYVILFSILSTFFKSFIIGLLCCVFLFIFIRLLKHYL